MRKFIVTISLACGFLQAQASQDFIELCLQPYQRLVAEAVYAQSSDLRNKLNEVLSLPEEHILIEYRAILEPRLEGLGERLGSYRSASMHEKILLFRKQILPLAEGILVGWNYARFTAGLEYALEISLPFKQAIKSILREEVSFAQAPFELLPYYQSSTTELKNILHLLEEREEEVILFYAKVMEVNGESEQVFRSLERRLQEHSPSLAKKFGDSYYKLKEYESLVTLFPIDIRNLQSSVTQVKSALKKWNFTLNVLSPIPYFQKFFRKNFEAQLVQELFDVIESSLKAFATVHSKVTKQERRRLAISVGSFVRDPIIPKFISQWKKQKSTNVQNVIKLEEQYEALKKNIETVLRDNPG